MGYFQEATTNFINSISDDVIVDEHGDERNLAEDIRSAIQEFAESTEETSVDEDNEMLNKVMSEVDQDQEPERIIEDTIAAVREWFGIL